MKYKCQFEVNGFTYEIKKGFVYEIFKEVRIAKYKMMGNLSWKIEEHLSNSIRGSSLVIRINKSVRESEQLNPTSRKELSKKFWAQLKSRPQIEDASTEKYSYYAKRRQKYSSSEYTSTTELGYEDRG